MKWFRSNIKHGSRLALFALAIQFALSFGHFHGLAARAAPAIQSGLARPTVAMPRPRRATDGCAAAQQPSQPRYRPAAADACAICAVISLANNVLFATPPLLVLPQAVEFSYLTTDAEFVHLKSAGIAFPAPRTSRLLISID